MGLARLQQEEWAVKLKKKLSGGSGNILGLKVVQHAGGGWCRWLGQGRTSAPNCLV